MRRFCGSATSPLPTCCFTCPFELPFLGEWFNLLPFLVVGLMLVQTKLFAPPATTPEAEMQQKMMKYMMVFMGFMFYKVPSGLGIYFITSSLWAIGERLLLPKVTHATSSAPVRRRGRRLVRRPRNEQRQLKRRRRRAPRRRQGGPAAATAPRSRPSPPARSRSSGSASSMKRAKTRPIARWSTNATVQDRTKDKEKR